jgi:LEA14-like dessication related protein
MMQYMLLSFKNTFLTKVFVLLASVILFNGCKVQYTDVVFHGVDCCKVGEAKNGKMMIGFGLDVENPNNFNIKVTDYDVDVSLNGIKVGKAKSNENIILKKGERNSYPLQVEADIAKVLAGNLMNLGSLFGGGKPKELEATISGNIRASVYGVSKAIPVEGKYPINLNGM